MKITPANIYNIYSSNNKSKSVAKAALPTQAERAVGVKMDTVSISKESMREKKLQSITAEITGEVMQEDSSLKIARLREQIESKQYDASGSSIADAMLGKFYRYTKEVR